MGPPTLVLPLTLQFKEPQVHPVIWDLTVTAAASLGNFIAGLVVISIFGRLLGVVLLSEYLLLRRVAGWLQPMAYLGLGVALPRHIAYSTKRSPGTKLEYFVAAIACIVSFNALFGLVLYAARSPLAVVLFGDNQHSRFMVPLFLLMFGATAQAAVYGYYRGCLNMKRAGAIQMCAAIVPLIAVAALFQTRSVSLIVSAIGCSVFAVAVAFTTPIIFGVRCISVSNIPARAVELLKYGLPRVPGDLSNGALLAIGPVLALHFMPITRVSYLLVASSMLAAMSVSTEPLGLVFLSKISMMLAGNRDRDVQSYLTHLMSAILDTSVFLTTQVIVFADVLVRAWIGPSLMGGMNVIRLVLLGVPFYLFYTALRSAVDAGSLRPLNARNIVVSLIVLVLFIALSVSLVPKDFLLHAIAICIVLSCALLAYLTKASLSALYSLRLQWKQSVVPVGCAAVLAALGLTYHRLSSGSLLGVIALELVFGLVFLGACFLSGSPWTNLLRELIFSSGNEAGSL